MSPADVAALCVLLCCMAGTLAGGVWFLLCQLGDAS